jgi:hypothetical protein
MKPKKKKRKRKQPHPASQKLGLAMVQLPAKSENNPPEARQTKDKFDDQENQERDDIMSLKESLKRPSVTDWSIAAFTFVLAITGILQWCEIHSGSVDTRKLAQATVASSRAWVAPQQLILTSSVEAGLPMKFQVRLFNPGKEPALGIIWALKPYGVTYIADGNGEKAEAGENEMCSGLEPTPDRETVLYPNGPMNFWLPLDIPDTGDNRALLESVQKKQKSLVIDGCFAYITATQKHLSAFRFFLRDVAGPSFVADKQGNQVPAWNFNLALDGNGAD